jgi:hypothetical protein
MITLLIIMNIVLLVFAALAIKATDEIIEFHNQKEDIWKQSKK